MKIIKRSGSESQFDMEKIISAVIRANDSVAETERMSKEQIAVIAANMRTICEGMNRALSVEEIQDLVENQIMNQRAFSVARNYITYRYKRALVRKSNSTDEQILSLLEFDNEEVKQENSNKNPAVNSVQRDYMAGEVSKDITKRFLLPSDIVEAHEKGLIHFHDADYFAQHMHNCCLVNLDDMLENGTVISETMIEKPHSFSLHVMWLPRRLPRSQVPSMAVRVFPCPIWFRLYRSVVKNTGKKLLTSLRRAVLRQMRKQSIK